MRNPAGTRRLNEGWPVISLLLAVTVPAVCLVWFTNTAMRNERFAARQQLAELYRDRLLQVQERFAQEWKQRVQELEAAARLPPAAAFHKCLQSGFVETAVILDSHGRVAYPNRPGSPPAPFETPSQWAEALAREYVRKDPASAAALYAAAAAASADVNATARALQAQARCLRRAGQNDAALKVIAETLREARFDRALDGEGRIIVANAELMAMEMAATTDPQIVGSIAGRLHRRITDYENPLMPASQRLFLMKELQRLQPQLAMPGLKAEELAAEWSEKRGVADSESVLRRSPIPGLWQFTTTDQRVVGLIRREKLFVIMEAAIPNAEVALLPPDDPIEAFVSVPAGAEFPGWRLAMSISNMAYLTSATKHRTAIYVWTAALVIAVVGMLTFISVRLMRRQVAVARLKNDLAATVSHELKTPLSSMRVLVDTLLDSEKFDERQVREYLKLIAGENERLCRLVQNFLTFSRTERRNHAFQFERVSPRDIVGAALEATADRLGAPGCRLNLELTAELPDVLADYDALTTALVNLLDNACKYSGDTKQINLRVFARADSVLFTVQDNGIGIGRRELKRIFREFYQIDRRLSRERGGCGLGLSIVKCIVAAHRGQVSVVSEAGHGSTFSIRIPALARDVDDQRASA